MQSSRNSQEEVGVDGTGHRVAAGKIITKPDSDPAEVASQKLAEARNELTKRNIENAKNQAHQVRAILQAMKASASKEAHGHIDLAIGSCDDCIGAANGEDAHDGMMKHIAMAEQHLGNAVTHMHKGPPPHKPIRHHGHHELVHIEQPSQHIAS